MFFGYLLFNPINFCILIAVIPAIFLMIYVYNQDTFEKEPPAMLLQLVGGGILAALVSIVLETFGTWVLESVFHARRLNAGSELYSVLSAFLVVAVVEEGSKLFFLRRRTWNDPNFDYLFDAIVYAAFVSLGFAAFENVKYVFSYGVGVALPRAVLSIPGHFAFSIVMGIFYGKAKMHENRGETGLQHLSMAGAYLFPVLMHGFYDSCAMTGTGVSNALFAVIVAVIYFIIIVVVRREARHNEPI